MTQVKLVRNRAGLIERDINAFLTSMATNTEYVTELKDIKLYHSERNDTDTALIIYSYTKIQ